jgi:hypothetical protein
VYQQNLNGRINPQEEGELIRIKENVLSLEHGEQRRDRYRRESGPCHAMQYNKVSLDL